MAASPKPKKTPSAKVEQTPAPHPESKVTTLVVPAIADLRGQLRDDIIRCVLIPGQRLKFDELRTRYDASIASLREALLQLVSEGLVLTESNRGFRVTPVSIADLTDITELRIDMESKALTQSILLGDDAWEASIVAAFHMLTKTEPAVAEAPVPQQSPLWNERHARFHDALVSACPSPWLMRFRQILLDQSLRYRALSMKQSRTPGRVDEHRRLMDLVLARDVPGATEAMEQHIRRTFENVRGWLSTQGANMMASDHDEKN